MPTTYSAVIRAIVGCLYVSFLLVPSAEARSRNRHQDDNSLDSSVGRNAPEAITSGLAEQGAGWLDTMANFYADPHVDNRGYFDYYRRPYYGYLPAERRR